MRPARSIAIGFLCAAVGAAHAALANPGDLDPTFGSGGIVTTPIGSSSFAAAVVLQPDGKLVAAGQSNGGLGHVTLARYLANGTLDPGFGAAGVVTTPIQSSSAALGIVCQPDGKLVAAGSASTGSTSSFAVVRYDSDGTLDAGFGSGGIVVTPIGSTAGGEGVALQGDDKIVVVGTTGTTTSDFALARYEADGNLDPTFGTGGIVITAVGPNVDIALALALQTDGRIVAAGTTNTGGSQSSFALVRYELDGTLDATFGTGGVVTTTFTGSTSRAHGLVVQPDGKLVAAGDSVNPGVGVAMARYETDGSLDSGFANAGKFYANPGATAFAAFQSVRYQAPNWLVAAGTIGTVTSIHPFTTDSNFLITRFGIADGAIDFSVATNNGPSDGFSDVAVQPDAKIVGAGTSNGHMALARYVTTTCGDAIQEDGELCDDGNQIDGDGCDSNCTPTACGNGVVTAGETCDDGNTMSGDCCSATCQADANGTACPADANPCTDDVCNAAQCTHPPNTLPCDDGDACTTNDVCSAGQCQATPTVCPPCESCDPGDGSCIAAPQPVCSAPLEAGKARLQIRDAIKDPSDKLLWKWLRGSDLPFGVPDNTYTLCIYSAGPSPSVLSRATARVGLCGGKLCWHETASGWTYKDSTRTPDGIESIVLRAGGPLKGRITVKGKGTNLPLPGLPLTLPVRVQLQAGNGSCWEATYSAVGAKKNDAAQFNGSSD